MGDATYLYDPVDGGSATDLLKRYCDVLLIDSLAAAQQYIVDARKEGSLEAYEALRASVLGVALPGRGAMIDADYAPDSAVRSPWFVDTGSSAVQRRPAESPRMMNLGRPQRVVSRGGAPPEDEFASKLQQFADACHDFGHVDPGEGRDMLEILERSIFGDEVEYLVPRMTRSDVADKSKFIRAATTCDGFKFKIGDRIVAVDANPMKGRNLEAAITPFAKGSPGRRVVGKVVNDEMQTVDVFFGKAGPNHKLIVLDNIHKLRDVMADFFGDPFATDRARPKFMVDQDMSPYTRATDPHRHLFAWMTGFGHMSVAIDLHFKGAKPLSDVGFDFVYCDATVYDGAMIAKLGDTVTFSPGRTGLVFHEKSTVNVEFGELALRPGERDAFTYTVTTTDPVRNPLTTNLRSSLTREVRDGRYRGAEMRLRPDNSARTMGDLVEDLVQAGFDVAGPVTQKTAGDWGQIEHCRQYGIALVTADRLTALRAASREVATLLVKHHDYATDRYAQYSFCMFGTPVARRALTEAMVGGSVRSSIFFDVALAAVVVACAGLNALRPA